MKGAQLPGDGITQQSAPRAIKLASKEHVTLA